MRTEELERIVLRTFGTREFYGYDVQRQLASKNINVGISRLYRVLTGMLRNELLEYRWEKSDFGPKKRIYLLSEKGAKERDKILLNAIETVHSFYIEYLQNLLPKADMFRRISKLMSKGLKGSNNIALVTPKYSVSHDRVLHALHNELSEGKIFLVKPKSLKINLNLDHFILLDGAYDNIPLKNSYVDLLVIAGVPSRDALEKSLQEWRRVLKEDGTLVLPTPSVLVHKYEDPMSIGNFIEKFEHETLEKGEFLDKRLLKVLLKRYFAEVKEKKIAHITIFFGFKSLPAHLDARAATETS